MAVQDPAPPEKAPEEQWPSIGLAYDLAVKPSTDFMMKRFDVVEGRIRALATFAPTFTFAAVIFGRSVRPDASLTSPWLALGILVALGITVCGVLIPTWGEILIPHPRVLYQNSLHLSPWEFKRDALYFAAETFEINANRLERKARVANIMAIFLFVEIILLIAWGFRDF